MEFRLRHVVSGGKPRDDFDEVELVLETGMVTVTALAASMPGAGLWTVVERPKGSPATEARC